MSKNKFHTLPNAAETNIVEVKSKFDAEYRRFGLKRNGEPPSFESFNTLVKQLHGLFNIQFLIRYIDPSDHTLLPINNDKNFEQAIKTAHPILRIIVQREEDMEYGVPKPQRNNFMFKGMLGQTPGKHKGPPISMPIDFRQVSQIIDVDIVPETHRRVRLLKHGSDKPLGFYIRDGTSVRVTQNGLEKQPSIFISRLVPGGLAESTGLLAVNDEVIEVNGIEVAGKTLDQVTDMMVANSSNLIITFKPANQRTLSSPRRGSFSRTSQLSSGSHHTNHTNTSDELEQDDQDEVVDLTGITLDDNTGNGSGAAAGASTLTSTTSQHSHHNTHHLASGGVGGGNSTIVVSRDGVLNL